MPISMKQERARSAEGSLDGDPCNCEEGFTETAVKRKQGKTPLCQAYVTRGIGYFHCRKSARAIMSTEAGTSYTLCNLHRKQIRKHGACAHCRRFSQKGYGIICPNDDSHFTDLRCAKRQSFTCSHCNVQMEKEDIKWIDRDNSKEINLPEIGNSEETEGLQALIKRVIDCSTELPPGWLDGGHLSTAIVSRITEDIEFSRLVGAALTPENLCQLADPSFSQMFGYLHVPDESYHLISERCASFEENTALSMALRRQNWDFFLLLLKHFSHRGVDVDARTGTDDKSLRKLCEQAPKTVQDAVKKAEMIRGISAGLQLRKVIHEDLSRGTERFPIRVINEVDDEKPMSFAYSTRVVDRCGVLTERKSGEMLICNCRDGCTIDCECNSGVYEEDGRARLNMLETPFLECSSDCACNMGCANRVAQKGAKHPIEIFRTSDPRGWGVRALCKIPKGTFIGEYTGELLTDAEANRRVDSYLFETAVGDTNFTVDARIVGNFTRFINHSCEPNGKVCMVVWDWQTEQLSHICIFAIRDIYRGEEITISYGEHWWRAKIVDFPCLCGQPSCQFTEAKREVVLRKLQQQTETSSTSSTTSYDSESSV